MRPQRVVNYYSHSDTLFREIYMQHLSPTYLCRNVLQLLPYTLYYMI